MNSIDTSQLSTLTSSALSNSGASNKTQSSQTTKNEFLQLMVAQLKNQNPLDPQNSGEFLSQLAQFSSVDGIQQLNTTLSDISGGFKSSQVLQATALVGRNVQVPSDSVNYKSLPVSGSIALNESSSDVHLTISTPSGQTVREFSLGASAAGNLAFSWDGLDNSGNPVASGQYKLSATANGEGNSFALNTLVDTNVNSVTVGQDSSVTLNLANTQSVALDQVKQIH